jgi:hypothetical protein
LELRLLISKLVPGRIGKQRLALEQPRKKGKDYVWWCISASSGALIWSFPALVHSGGKGSSSSMLIALAALFISGIAFGYFEPKCICYL